MYENEKQIVTLFEARLQALIDKYNEFKELNSNLNKIVAQQEAKINELQSRYNELEQMYLNLKQARMISISYEEVDAAKEHITRLVREIDHCIDSLIKKH